METKEKWKGRRLNICVTLSHEPPYGWTKGNQARREDTKLLALLPILSHRV